MIGAVVNVLEFSFILFATFKALLSFARPTMKNVFNDMLFILPVSIILPYFVARAEAKELEDN